MSYDWRQDPFYQKEQIHITWIMIWNGSTETHWWIPEHYRGIEALVDGKFQSIDWNNPQHVEEYFHQMREAGIDVIASDLTNGLRWRTQTQQVQRLCKEYGMKLCVAINHHGNPEEYEHAAQEIWTAYADPDSELGSAYFYKDGKPLIVDYCWQNEYEIIRKQDTEYGRRFSHGWASGEKAAKDKWGWQVEPQSGVIPSQETMYVTPSISYDSPFTGEQVWRRSLSWMDYGFLVAAEHHPRYLIAGSFDDVHERNGWFRCDTRHATPCWQMRDVTGAISVDVYYERVKTWLKEGAAQPFFPGGSLKDGAYRLTVGSHDFDVAPRENRYVHSPLRLKVPDSELDALYWLYHLGDDYYRIIKLNSGLSLESSNDRDGSLVWQNYDSESYIQQWKLTKNENGTWQLRNRAHAMVLALSHLGDVVVSRPRPEDDNQQWKLTPVRTL